MTQKSLVLLIQRIFIEIVHQSCQLVTNFLIKKSPYFDNRVQQVTKIWQDFSNIVLPSLTHSQNLVNSSCA
jgi:hypothetical protein